MLLGVFAIHGDQETSGDTCASMSLCRSGEILWRGDLMAWRHVDDATRFGVADRMFGDGVCLKEAGSVEFEGKRYRVDLLTVDLELRADPDEFMFRDLGTPASFLIFDIAFGYQEPAGCPFSARGGGVSLADLGSIVRIGDRVRFDKAVHQLGESLNRAEDLDEAKGEALTFLALLTAATLELGGGREMHRVQLDAARAIDPLRSPTDVFEEICRWAGTVSDRVFDPTPSPSDRLIDRALSIIDRNFAKDLSDTVMADQLGLSTSHFRFLFRQATGLPFHKYLVALRLEKARRLLVEQDLPVSQVASAVGFSGLSHFSRAFSQRFDVSPTSLRRKAS
jgi:AraC-like DNA-binding protein